MRKLLYITVNTKPEELSSSKTVGREFVKRFLEKNHNYSLDEIDLYDLYLPVLKYTWFTSRAHLVQGEKYDALPSEDKKGIDTVNLLSDQFLEADRYVIAAPMWSVSFPARLKEYIDCIILQGKLINVQPQKNMVEGLLGDRERYMVYIQSSGGDYPPFFSGKFNHGVSYIKDIFEFLGVKSVKKIMVEGVDDPDIGRDKAILNAFSEMDSIIEAIS